MTAFRLSEDEKKEIKQLIGKVKPEDERRVYESFEEKYGAIGRALLRSKFKAVRELATNVLVLWEMLRDGSYTIAWETKAAIIFALGYFLSPVDLIPDTFPVVGYVDDAMVVAFVIEMLDGEIADYRKWREECGRPLPRV